MPKSKSNDSRKALSPSDAEIVATMDYAGTAIFLLSDYGRYGLAERICYHFDLIEALAVSKEKSILPSEDNISNSSVSGVAGILECTPLAPWHRLIKRQKRALKNQLRLFNQETKKVRESQYTSCYQPKNLPLGLHPTSRLYFAYEVTRIAFCVDASPSLTSTFGVTGNSQDHSCPLDNLPQMARTFFKSLVEDVDTSLMTDPGCWRPELAVTVIAVYPLGKTVETSLLVRDYRVKDVKSAEVLADKIDEWIHHEVELGISERMCRDHAANTFCVPLYSSSMRNILETGDYALSVLSSESRPLIVVATDCRSVSCEGIVDVYLDIDRVDIPVFVLDLSTPETHAITEQPALSGKDELNFLTYDPPNPSAFPLHLSDDSEALYGICRATGGCFLDWNLLLEASKSVAGAQSATEGPLQDLFKRKFVKMNSMQWLVLFSLSPLSPTFHSSWGKVAPPKYLQKHLKLNQASDSIVSENQSTSVNFSRHESFSKQASKQVGRSVSDYSSPTHKRQNTNSRITFSTYVVSPIRIKTLLLVRLKEGYRAKQYGSSTQDADKVFIQFTLPLQLGTVLHYELSYTALSSQNHMAGSAHIKIELSGNTGFIQSVKNDFLRQIPRQVPDSRPFSMAQKVSARLCQVLRWIRIEDLKCSYLGPPTQWSNQLGSSDTPFVKRLGSLTPLQRRRHFQFDEFDILFTGRMPYTVDDEFLSEFMANDNGEQELFEHLSKWSTQVVKPKSRYVKQTQTSNGITEYCVIDLKPSTIASRLCSVRVESYGGIGPTDRLETLVSLKSSIDDLKDVEVLRKQLGPYIVGISNTSFWNRGKIEIQYHHARWDLVIDPELLPLLMKRRLEIGQFRLLDSNPSSAIFAKLVEEKAISVAAGDLLQYQIAISADKVVIDLHMESESGVFSPFLRSRNTDNRFDRMVKVIRRRDQECGRALRSRTNLLRVLQSGDNGTLEDLNTPEESHCTSARRILAYSSAVSRKLRFFNLSDSPANDLLCQMTEDLLLSEPFGARAAKLAISSNELMAEEGPGLWFVVQFDRDTMSLVRLSLIDKQEENNSRIQTYRNLTFFTSSISDLYSKRDDMRDDDSIDSHISEHLCVTDFADHVDVAMDMIFSAAAYLALRTIEPQTMGDFDPTDFGEVMESCEFVKVASVFVAGATSLSTDDNAGNEEHSKLYELIRMILQPVTGNDECMFYCGNGRIEDLTDMNANDSDSESSGTADSLDILDSSAEENEEEGDLDDDGHGKTGTASALDADEDSDDANAFHKTLPPPLFVRFQLDGNRALLRDLHSISKRTRLTAHISVFKTNVTKELRSPNYEHRFLPWSHQAAAIELSSLLKSYVAEQTIENLRCNGRSISQDGLQLVKRCLKRVRTVVYFSIDVFFYVSRTDQMVPSSAPAGGEFEVEEGFLSLKAELRNNEDLTFKSLSGGGFVVFPPEGSDDVLEFYCFVYVEKGEGVISQMYHPEGEEKAAEVMSRIHSVVRSCVHRVNQVLLLKSLHRSRTASNLMIPSPEENTENSESSDSRNLYDSFKPGVFSCPVVFRSEFDLYYRCASNPSQVARTLEATVLHSFAVSNRRSIFVYKDESGAIFYMSLQAIGTSFDGDGKVALLVHGVDPPGPSVTLQLKSLLQRRLLLIAVDMLSSVLTKNPHFNWKLSDFEFLRSFETDWASLEQEAPTASEQTCVYEFPAEAYDCCLILLMFRQNICGSTFLHRLNDIGHDGLSPHITLSEKLDSGGVSMNWNQHAFTLYYNYAPSKLDPSFQGVSTLTEKGEMLCREAGTGIAMLEVTLIKSNGEPLDECAFGIPTLSSDSVTKFPIESLRCRKLETFPVTGERSSICVQVRISGTTIKRDYLHQLVALTLDQALIAWYVERLLEKTALRRTKGIAISSQPSGRIQSSPIEKLCPELPGLIEILEYAHTLPHPAINKVFDTHGAIRSSSVATTTLEQLEMSVLPLIGNTETPEQMEMAKSRLHIVRLSRSDKPKLVNLSWDARRREAVVKNSKSPNNEVLKDSPIDCPEYICFFWLTEHDGRRIDPNLRVCEEVMIHDGISEWSPTIELLESVKKENPSAFYQSLAFVFSVKRNRRSLWAYNFNPQIVKSISERLNESELAFLSETGRSVGFLQSRCLHILAPSSGFHGVKENQSILQPTTKDRRQSPSSPNRNKDIHSSENRPARPSKIRRPVFIRRPKLVGKSVEGAAMQAVAASRKRASTNQFKNVAMSTPTKRPPNQRLTRQSSRGSQTGDHQKTTIDSSVIISRAPRNVQTEQEEQDENLSRVKSDFSLLCSVKQSQLQRRSTLHREALIKLASLWWPQKMVDFVPQAVAKFLVCKAPLAWSDSRLLPPIPTGVQDFFIITFARYVATFTPGLKLVSLTASRFGTKDVDSVLLSSDIKNVRGCKCLAVVLISKVVSSRGEDVVRCQGMVLNLPRRSKTEQRMKIGANVKSILSSEKDSAGMDKLAGDLHRSLVLDSLLFDFSASIVERAVRLQEQKIDLKDLIPTLRGLISRYPLERQKRMGKMNYRAFEATIVLKSYEDRFIGMFNSKELFSRLFIEAEERDMIRCGKGLCFKKGISVRGCHSVCFLTPHSTDLARMQLVILCRTQGRNLSDFMFREGSNVAMRILDNIVLEGSSIAFAELRLGAKMLLKDSLWELFSSKSTLEPTTNTQEDIREMLTLTNVRPLQHHLGNTLKGNGLDISTLLESEAGIDWISCCHAMECDPSFAPNWSLNGNGITTHLFFMEPEDVFLLIGVDANGALFVAGLVEKDESMKLERRQITIQKFSNFLLHFIWQSL